MAYNSTPPKTEYVASAGQTAFPFLFKIFFKTDVKVYVTSIVSGITSELTLTTDFTVSIDGDDGGTIILNTGATQDDIYVIQRELSLDRLVEYQTNGDLLANTLNNDQDYQTYLIADQAERVDYAVQAPPGVPGFDGELPYPIPYAHLMWDSDGKSIVNSIPGDGVEGLPYIENIAALSTIDTEYTSCVNVKGYSTANDGGGGIFNYDASYIGTNNGGTILNGWVRQYSGALNVQWFGAVGDGVADDSSAIQLALDIARDSYNDNGNTVGLKYTEQVFFPPAEYYIGTSLNLTDVRHNTGQNEAPLTIMGYGAVLMGNCTDDIVLDCTASRYIYIKGLTIYGDTTNIPKAGIQFARGIDFAQASANKLEDVHIRGTYTLASLYNMASEVFSAITSDFANNQEDSYCVILDGVNFYAASSSHYPVTATQYTKQSNIIHNFYDCTFGQGNPGVTRKALQCIEANRVRLHNCYMVVENAPAVEVATYYGDTDTWGFDLDFHMESTEYNPTYLVEFTDLSGGGIDTKIVDFVVRENNSHATVAQIGNNTGGKLTIDGADIKVINTRPDAANVLFSNSSVDCNGSILWGDPSVMTGMNIDNFNGVLTVNRAIDVTPLPTAGAYDFIDTESNIVTKSGGLYEEGFFDATFTFDTPGDLSVTYSVREFEYVKIGQFVSFTGLISFTPTFTTSAGTPRIEGLPYPKSTRATTNLHTSVAINDDNTNINYPAGAIELHGRIRTGADYIEMHFGYGGTANPGEADTNAVTSGVNNAMRITGSYIT